MNPALAIRAEGLSKSYRLGVGARSHATLQGTASALARRLRRANGKAEPDVFWALRDVSFEIRAGEAVGIIGPNGAGKSTLLKILAQIVAPTRGRAEIRGRLGALLEVGTGFHHELTGRENIYLNGAILGMRRKEIAAKLDAIVDFAGVEGFLDTPVKRYSSGMHLRFAFAVAAHVDPDILVIDEVLAVGDAAFQSKCIAKAEAVTRTGRTVLFISHQMSIVQRVCTRAILLEAGRVIREGPTGEVVQAYLSALEARALSDAHSREDRVGRGLMRVAAIEIGAATGPLVSGQPARIRIGVDGVRAPSQCMVTIVDQMGEPVTAFDTADNSMHDRDGEEFIVDVPALLLRPGRYRLDVALIGTDRVVEDHLATAAMFDVQPGLIDDRSVPEAPGFGSVTLPHRWTVRR